jgi:ribosomal protein L11 methylase PrmA
MPPTTSVALELRHSKEKLDKQFDIVVANILTNPLCVLAPLLAGRVAPGRAHRAVRRAGHPGGTGDRRLRP